MPYAKYLTEKSELLRAQVREELQVPEPSAQGIGIVPGQGLSASRSSSEALTNLKEETTPTVAPSDVGSPILSASLPGLAFTAFLATWACASVLRA